MRAAKKQTHVHRKRHGRHQKRTGHFLKVYTPYLPLTLLVLGSVLMSTVPVAGAKVAPQKNGQSVLAYATEMSSGGLLSATNQQRVANGLGSLALNGQLNNAAQSKANDMANRDYWSHNTPEGNTPWTFIIAAGYSYSRAGENLAYGYDSSSATVAAWMGSTSHRDNILNGGFVDVGFGVVNAANYTGDASKGPRGPQTIVVAMYAAPYSMPAPAPTPTAPPQAAKPTTPTTVAPIPSPVAQETAQATSNASEEKPSDEDVKTKVGAVSTDSNRQPPQSKSVSRLELLTHNGLPWLGTALLLFLVIGSLAVLTTHGLAFQRLLVQGERYVLQHTLFDITVVSLAIFYYLATRTTGIIL